MHRTPQDDYFWVFKLEFLFCEWRGYSRSQYHTTRFCEWRGYSRSQYHTARFCEWRDTQDLNIAPQDFVNGGILKIAISHHKILWMEGYSRSQYHTTRSCEWRGYSRSQYHTTRSLKFLWPFFNIKHDRVKLLPKGAWNLSVSV